MFLTEGEGGGFYNQRMEREYIDRLALAIIYQATLDVRGRDSFERKAAKAWLLETGQEWLSILEYNFCRNFQEWVNEGCIPNATK